MGSQNIFRILKNNAGFTLVELVLSIAIAGAIFGVAAETMIRQADTYSFIVNRKTTIADVRYAMERISHEMLRLETNDIQSISSTSINFTDKDGQDSSFSLSTNGGNLAVYRGSDVLVPSVKSFDIEYQDSDGNVLTADADYINDVRRIVVTITTEPNGNEGSITLRSATVPRAFIGYANFQ